MWIYLQINSWLRIQVECKIPLKRSGSLSGLFSIFYGVSIQNHLKPEKIQHRNWIGKKVAAAPSLSTIPPRNSFIVKTEWVFSRQVHSLISLNKVHLARWFSKCVCVCIVEHSRSVRHLGKSCVAFYLFFFSPQSCLYVHIITIIHSGQWLWAH